MEKIEQKGTESSLKLIDLLMRAAQHNTLLAWQGVDRCLAIGSAAVAIAALFKSPILDGNEYLAFYIILSIFVSLCMQLILPAIVRNSEHVFKYNLAIGELEKRICNDLPEEQIQYLPNHVYEKTLRGSKTGRHNKRAIKIIPWFIRFISDIVIGVCIFKLINSSKNAIIASIVPKDPILTLMSLIFILLFDPGLGVLSDKLLRLVYRNEVEDWQHEFYCTLVERE